MRCLCRGVAFHLVLLWQSLCQNVKWNWWNCVCRSLFNSSSQFMPFVLSLRFISTTHQKHTQIFERIICASGNRQIQNISSSAVIINADIFLGSFVVVGYLIFWWIFSLYFHIIFFFRWSAVERMHNSKCCARTNNHHSRFRLNIAVGISREFAFAYSLNDTVRVSFDLEYFFFFFRSPLFAFALLRFAADSFFGCCIWIHYSNQRRHFFSRFIAISWPKAEKWFSRMTLKWTKTIQYGNQRTINAIKSLET